MIRKPQISVGHDTYTSVPCLFSYRLLQPEYTVLYVYTDGSYGTRAKVFINSEEPQAAVISTEANIEV